ncbi:fimbrial protein, partial [Escherichia coli]|nr:fimbrial protein [Escherichia coli]
MLCRHHKLVRFLGLVTALITPFGYAGQDVDLTAQ